MFPLFYGSINRHRGVAILHKNISVTTRNQWHCLDPDFPPSPQNAHHIQCCSQLLCNFSPANSRYIFNCLIFSHPCMFLVDFCLSWWLVISNFSSLLLAASWKHLHLLARLGQGKWPPWAPSAHHCALLENICKQDTMWVHQSRAHQPTGWM